MALSTLKAEFVAAAVEGRDTRSIGELFEKIGLKTKAPIVLKIDHQAAIKYQLQNEASAAKAKNIDVKLEFLKDYAKKGKVQPEHVGSQDMVADFLTKTLDTPRMKELRDKTGLK